jgi:hypothetical protein
VNDKTVRQTLHALQTQASVAAFIESNQGKSAAEIQQAFAKFMQDRQTAPEPLPGSGLNYPPLTQVAKVGGQQ